MARTDNLSNFLKDVADSIRSKTGKTALIPASNFDTEIESISGGGDPVVHPRFLTFTEYPYDTIDLSWLRTDQMTTFKKFFQYASALRSVDVSKFDTSNITDFSMMFYYASGLTTLNLSNFNTSKGTTFESMFTNAGFLSLTGIKDWNMKNATTVHGMFSSCGNLGSIDISNWELDKINSLESLFYGCQNLNSVIAPANGINNITKLQQTFASCLNSKKIDLSFVNKNSNTKVINLVSVCNYCRSAEEIDMSTIRVESNCNISNAFTNCTSLKKLDIRKMEGISGLTNKNTAFNDIPDNCEIFVNNYEEEASLKEIKSTFNNIVVVNKFKMNYSEGTYYGMEMNINNFSLISKELTSLELQSSDGTISNFTTTREGTYRTNMAFDYIVNEGIEKEELNFTLIATDIDNNQTEYNFSINWSNAGRFEVRNLSNVTYGFNLNANEYYESTNKNRNNSFSMTTIFISGAQGKNLNLECISYGENNYDYGLISNLDYELSKNNYSDGATGTTKVFHSFKGESSPNPKFLSIPIPDNNDHLIYIKYIKDSSSSSGSDTFQFKVTLE